MRTPRKYPVESKLKCVIDVRELVNSGECSTVDFACKIVGVTRKQYRYFSDALIAAGKVLPPISREAGMPVKKRGFTTDAAFIRDDGKKHKPVAVVMSERGVPVGWFDSWAEAGKVASYTPGSMAVAG